MEKWVLLEDFVLRAFFVIKVSRGKKDLDARPKPEHPFGKLFAVYAEQRKGLDALKEKYGSVVTPTQLEEAAG